MKLEKPYTRNLFAVVSLLVSSVACASGQQILESYRNAGSGPFSASAGEAAWTQQYQPAAGGKMRSCASCHGVDLGQLGKHIKTGKKIEPMARSVNSERLSDPKKVEKWFRRNCRWTLGRECSSQEKGDFVQYMNQP